MLQIKVNGEFLDGFESVKITLEIGNNALDLDELKGSYSYGFNFPATENNQRILGYPHLVNNANSSLTKFDADLYNGSVFLYNVILILLNTNAKVYRTTVMVGASFFGQLIKDFNLRDLDLGGVRDHTYPGYPSITTIREHFKQLEQSNPPYGEFDYAAPVIFNPGMYLHEERHCLPFGIGDIITDQMYINSPYYNGNNTYCPFPYAVYVLDRIFSEFGYTHTGLFKSDQELRTLLVYNDYILNTRYFSDNNDSIGEKIYGNLVNTSFDLKNHVPNIKVSEYLNTLKTMFCLLYIFNDFDKTVEIVPFKDVINTIDFDDITQEIIQIGDLEPYDYKGFTLDYDYDQSDELNNKDFNVSDISTILSVAVDEVSPPYTTVGETRLHMAIDVYYQSKQNLVDPDEIAGSFFKYKIRSSISHLEGLQINTPVNILDDLPSYVITALNSITLVKSLNQYWILKHNDHSAYVWEYYCDNNQATIIDGGEKKIKVPDAISTRHKYSATQTNIYAESLRYGNIELRVPCVSQLASSLSQNNASDNFKLRFLFNRGINYLYWFPGDEAGGEGLKPYVFASSDTTNYEGYSVGNYSLSWEGDTGLKKVWWDDVLEFLKTTKRLKVVRRMSITQLKNINLKRKLRINNLNFIVEHMTPELPIKEYGPVQFDLLLA